MNPSQDINLFTSGVPRPTTPDSPRQSANVNVSSLLVGGDPASHAGVDFSVPTWLFVAMVSLQARYPGDRFEPILRKASPEAAPEWRIICLDCPGKLYNPGPGDSLSNYEVHLKNRQHLLRVSRRVNSTAS